MNTLARKLTMNAPNRIFNTSYRFVRARWERGCLKDLYHRRVLAGADPMLSRSAYPNWDYRSELFAFSHRIGAAETLGNDQLIRAMTNETFFSRADVQSDSSGAQPSKEDFIESKQHNSQLISIGEHKLLDVISGYLRYSLPSAPEELIQAVTNELSSTDSIASLGKNLGIDCLIRTAEFPPSNESLANAFKALLAVLDAKRAESLVVSVVVPQLLDIDFIEVYPLRDPYQVLTNVLQSKGFKCIEPRLQRSAGVVSAEPVYIVGIYADEKLVGKSAGESLSIAVDMASREALLRQWGLSSDRCLPFGERAHSIDFSKFLQPNVYLRDVCNENTDLSLCEYAENSEEVLNVVDVAMQYKQQIEPLVGRSLTKRLRHKFSRGSLAKRSFRHMIKPIVRTVC